MLYYKQCERNKIETHDLHVSFNTYPNARHRILEINKCVSN